MAPQDERAKELFLGANLLIPESVSTPSDGLSLFSRLSRFGEASRGKTPCRATQGTRFVVLHRLSTV